MRYTTQFIRKLLSNGYRNINEKYTDGQFKTLYLISYNVIQTLGFAYVLLMIVPYTKLDYASFASTHLQLGTLVKLLHIMQILETIHPMIGLTKGKPTVPFFQLFGRLIILFLMIDPEPRMQIKAIVPYLYCVWSTIEIIRHAYYVAQLSNVQISLLTWLRYSAWILLYPMGIFGESAVVIMNIPFFQETMKFCVNLPNTWNFGLDFTLLMKIYVCVLICPVMFILLNHMHRMRVKKMAHFTFKPFIVY